MKLVVINSLGPMGSTVAASVIEKFGYINLPNRKTKLEEYVLKKRSKEDPYFKNRIITIINELSEKKLIGGTSVIDRDKNIPKKRINKNIIDIDVNNFLNTKYNNIEDLYFASSKIIEKGVIYKDKLNNIKGAIELATNLEQHNAHLLYEAYKKSFKDVVFINLHRSFLSWLNSLISQKIFRSKFKFNTYLIRLSSRKKNFDLYKKNIEQYKGFNINFDDLFLPNTKFLNEISKFFGENSSSFNWENFNYDLYGSLKNYNETFTKNDDNINYLSNFSKWVVARSLNSNYSLIYDLVFQFSYVFDLFTFNLRIKNEKEKNI